MARWRIAMVLVAVSAVYPTSAYARVMVPNHMEGRRASAPGDESSERATRRAALRAYLEREVMTSARFVDHGVLALGVAGGWPHRYRLALALGVLDHLSVGFTTHWLPGQRYPRIAPVAALAFYRGRQLTVGAVYQATLFPPPERDRDPATPDFERRADWVLAHLGLAQGWVSAGFEFGLVRARERDPGAVPPDDGTTPSRITIRPGGGLHVRAGTRRWGVTARVLAPHLLGELVFTLRFGLFERRPRGSWRLPPWQSWSDRRR